MVKFKTAEREIKNGYCNVIKVGYCNLQTLLAYENPIAYTCGKNGWKADIYEVNGSTVIVTGYAPFGSCESSFELCMEYEKKAEEIAYGELHWSYEEKRKIFKGLIDKFVEECLEENKEG